MGSWPREQLEAKQVGVCTSSPPPHTPTVNPTGCLWARRNPNLTHPRMQRGVPSTLKMVLWIGGRDGGRRERCSLRGGGRKQQSNRKEEKSGNEEKEGGLIVRHQILKMEMLVEPKGRSA